MTEAKFEWMGEAGTGLWVSKPVSISDKYPRARREHVGYIYKTEKGTYWCAVLYTGNVRAAVPTEQEARDLLLMLAKANHCE